MKRWGLRASSLSAVTKADAGQKHSINHLNPNVLYMRLPHVLYLRPSSSALAKTYSLASFGLWVGLCDLPMCMAFEVVILKNQIYIHRHQVVKLVYQFFHIFLNDVFLLVVLVVH